MAIRYVKDFEFPSAAGYSQSTPSKVTGQMLAKGGPAKAPKGMMVVIGIGKPKGPMKKAEGGSADKKYVNIGGARVEDTPEAKLAHVKKTFPNVTEVTDEGNPVFDKKAKGGKVAKVMHEYGKGELHSGSKKGPKVTNPKQAIAIALSEQRAAKKAKGGLQSEDGSPLKSVPVKDIKSGKVPQSTDEDFYGKAKNAPMPPRRPTGLKKGGMAHEDVAADRSLIKSMVKSDALKKADGGGVKPRGLFEGSRQTAPSMASTMPKKGGGVVKKADGGPIDTPSPLQQMALRQRMARAVPVAPRAPMIPQQAAPMQAAPMQAAPAGGPRIGVNAPRAGGPNVGAIRAAMARRASQAMPENAPSMMKKGGKVNC
jgi:hypothetical protein